MTKELTKNNTFNLVFAKEYQDPDDHDYFPVYHTIFRNVPIKYLNRMNNDAFKNKVKAFCEKNYKDAANFLYLGRGYNFPVALEGALKLKEISYIHAEGYPAGELKHGPLALVDEDMPVICVAPTDELLEKVKSNLQEVSARGGVLYVFTDHRGEFGDMKDTQVVILPALDPIVAPIAFVLPLQLLSYHVAVLRGTDVDQPRNLAKSVTVE